MDIKAKAISRIANQLASLVGNENFRIIAGDAEYGTFTDAVAVKAKKLSPKIFDFKNGTDFYARIGAMKPGDVQTFSLEGIEIHTLQSGVSGIAARFFGTGNATTSRRKDGAVDLLRLS